MVSVKLLKDQITKEPASREVNEIANQAFRKGLLLLPCGENVIRFSPPLVISSEEVDTAVEIFREVISQYEKKRKVI